MNNKQLEDLPSTSGVYVVSDGAEAMYVGCTSDFHSRWKYHHLIDRQLSCLDYSKLTLSLIPLCRKEVYKREQELIKQLKPAWNYKHNEDAYNPVRGLDFIAFCVDEVSIYGRITQGSYSKGRTYAGAGNGRRVLRKKTHAYGDIPGWLVPCEYYLEKLKLTWPFTHEDIYDAMVESSLCGNDKEHRMYSRVLNAMEVYGIDLL